MIPAHALQVGPGWMAGAQQSCSITPLLRRIEERKYSKRLMSQDKDRGRSLTIYSQEWNKLEFGKIVLIPIKWV